jgi:CHAD domain-containing protein
MVSPRPPANPATHLLRQRIRALFRQVPKGLAGDEEAIHQMRVTGRRLRVALPLLAFRPAGRRVRRALLVLRQLTRVAGQSRDLDVVAGLFNEYLASVKDTSPEARLLNRRLRQARSRSRHRMAESLMDLEIARLRRDLRRIVARGGDALLSVHSRVRRSRDAWGDELLAGFTGIADRYEPEHLHALRRKARKLRYAAEVAGALRGQESEAPALLRDLQEGLGAIHDAHVLSVWLAGQAGRAELRGQAALAREARQLESHFVAESHRHHQALLVAGPRATVGRVLEAMGRARSAA